MAPGRRAAAPVLAVAAVLLASRAAALAGLVAGARGDVGAALRFVRLGADAGWYGIVVLHGYAGNSPAHPAAGFYPGYPLLAAAVFWPVHALSTLFGSPSQLGVQEGGGLLVAALLIASNGSLLVALWALWRLYRPLLGARAALLGLLLLLSAPGALFLSAGFSESSFIVATALAFLAATRGRWLWAGAAAAAACLVRPQGVLLALPLALLWLESSPPRPRTGPAAGLLVLALGVFAFPAYTWFAFGDALLYTHMKVGDWGVRLTSPADGLAAQWTRGRAGVRLLLGPPAAGRFSFSFLLLIDALSTALAVLAAIVGRLRLPRSHVALVALMVLVPLTSGVSVSLNRYVMAAWPMFFLFGWWLRQAPAPAAVLLAAGWAGTFLLARDATLGMFIG